MTAIAIVGDSFCADHETADTWPDIVVRTNKYDKHAFGFGSKSWWYSRQRFYEELERLPSALFRNQLEVIVFCHTNPSRINNAWNRDLSNTDTVSDQANSYYRHIYDNEFNEWAQQQWFKEIADRWGHLKTLHFHCFPDSVRWSALLPGVVFTTPLIYISVGELIGTKKEIANKLQEPDTRRNHLNTHNNQALATMILNNIYSYRPGHHDIDLAHFDVPNINASNWPHGDFGSQL